MKNLIYIFIFLLIISCRSIYKPRGHALDYRRAISYGHCEDAQKTIPFEKDNKNVMTFYQGSIGYLVSATFLPVTVALDIILISRCRYGCNDKELKTMDILFPTSTWTYESTKDFRCPDNSYYVQKFLEISSCYSSRNKKEDLKQAKAILDYLNDSFDSPMTCISRRDGAVIKDQLKTVNERIDNSEYQTHLYLPSVL